MSPFWIKALQLLLSLSILIVLHEGGHYVAARIFKTRVEKFFLFFDVKFALFKKKIGETVYGIGWLPLGGYVKIAGMIDESMDKEQMAKPPQPWEFRSKPAWQRLIIMLGGVTVNVIVGFLIFMMILFYWGKDYVQPEGLPDGFAVSQTMKDMGLKDGDVVTEINGKPIDNVLNINMYLMVRPVESLTAKDPDGNTKTISIPKNIGQDLFEKGEIPAFVPVSNTTIDSVFANTPAEQAGLKKGDQIVSINGISVNNLAEINAIKDADTTGVVRLGILKAADLAKNEGQIENKITRIAIEPQEVDVHLEDGKMGLAGTMNVDVSHQSYSFLESIKEGFGFTYWTLHDYIAQFKYVFTKKGATQLGGFGAIGSLFQPTWDWQSFWNTTAFISIILAFMNILPIPALDGGHVMFLLYEMITGRKPNEKVLEFAQMIGIILLLALVLYANGNDIYRYFFE